MFQEIYIVDNENNTVEKNNILTFLKTDSKINLKNVKYVVEKKTCLIISDGKTEYKIYKFYSNIVRLKDTLTTNGIETVSSKLVK